MGRTLHFYAAILFFSLACCLFLGTSLTDTLAAVPSLNKTSVTLKPKGTVTLSVSGTSRKIYYTSTKPSVAKVSTKGKVTAVKCGTAKIYAKAGTKRLTCTVKVCKEALAVSLDETSLDLCQRDYVQLKPSVTPSSTSVKGYSWVSSDTDVAYVDSKGCVETLREGTATITCTVKNHSTVYATCQVRVTAEDLTVDDSCLQADGSYKVTPNSKPYAGRYMHNKSYNDELKAYYLLQSYMDAFEEYGGGTLELSAGDYQICQPVFIPSNVTIILDDGVTVKKKVVNDGTSCTTLSIFQLVEPAWNVGPEDIVKYGYEGDHDVTLIGKGSATIDLQGMTASDGRGSLGIVIGHGQNISISGIYFTHMALTNHFIELNSSKNVTVTDCVFNGNVVTGKKEAINIDSTDENTHGFNNLWSSHDRTCCQDVTISDCTFENIPSGIGTHMYSATDSGTQLYHKNITIENCLFKNIGDSDNSCSAIRAENWADSTIINNTFKNCAYYMVRIYGGSNPTVLNNVFQNKSASQRIMLIRPIHHTGDSSYYPKSCVKNLNLENVLYNTSSGSQIVRVYKDDNTTYKDYSLKEVASDDITE